MTLLVQASTTANRKQPAPPVEWTAEVESPTNWRTLSRMTDHGTGRKADDMRRETSLKTNTRAPEVSTTYELLLLLLLGLLLLLHLYCDHEIDLQVKAAYSVAYAEIPVIPTQTISVPRLEQLISEMSPKLGREPVTS